MGFFWALLSVGLVSAAQLLLRSAMVALPPLTDIVAFLQHLLHFQPGTFGLFFGLPGRCEHAARRIRENITTPPVTPEEAGLE